MADEPEQPEKSDPHFAPPATLTDQLRERLFKARTLVVSGEVTQQMAAHVVAQLLALDADWLGAEAAKDYGLVGRIIPTADELE